MEPSNVAVEVEETKESAPRNYYVFDEKVINEVACRDQGVIHLRRGEYTDLFIHFHLYGANCNARCYEIKLPDAGEEVEYVKRQLMPQGAIPSVSTSGSLMTT